MTKTLTISSQKLFFHMIFTFILPCEQISIITEYFFQDIFSNSKVFKALKTVFSIQGYSRVFKACVNPTLRDMCVQN